MKFSRCILFIILFLLTDIFIGQARTTPDALESRGPRRDDLGEILDQFNLPYINNGGLAWDGEYLWGVTRANNRRLFCFDPRNDFEVIEDFNINQSDAIGMTWDPVDGVFWVCEHDVNQSRAFLYDRNGEQVDEIELPRGGHHGLAWDGEFFYAHSENSQQNPRIFKLDRDGRVVDEGPNLAAAINHGRAVSIEWVGAHDDGHFWVMSTGYISQLAIDFDNNEVEIIREFDSRNDDYPHQGITHDGYNLIAGGNWREQLGFIYDDAIEEAYGVLGIDREIFWFGPVPAGNTAEQTLRLSNLSEDEGDQYILEFELIDLGEDPNWLSFEPANGEINPGEFTDIEFLATTADLDLGEYERIVRIVSNASNVGDVDLTLTMIVVGGVGHLFGTVTDPAEEDRPIANALVQVVADFEMLQITDDEGRYDFGETPVFNYHLRCTHENYLPMEAENVEVTANEETEQNFAMLYGEFRCDPGQILQSMSPNEELQVPITISNRGNGPIGWSLERVFPEQVEFDPWELRESVNIEESLNDDRLNGAVFANGNFFITGGNYNYEDINKVYVLNSDGEHVRDFDQFNESRHGIRDITWDGRLLWGGDGDILYGFTTGGELVTSMETDAPSLRSITWDPDRDLFWTADITSNIIGIDANGDQQAVIDRPEDLRTYGLAYWTEDPDGYNLYAFARGVETDLQIFRIDPDNGEMMTAAHIDFIEGCRPSSISVTNRYDPYSWVMVSIIQTP
ncbi:carboxypeptidase regulatory-like domain-containing protein, partial [bacterium]|nr:carboxypeptidase regulatory-like domain-containing protein [bacterium]